jgi:hypothetical protein
MPLKVSFERGFVMIASVHSELLCNPDEVLYIRFWEKTNHRGTENTEKEHGEESELVFSGPL